MKADYVVFYLEGREAKLLRADIDTETIASEVMAGNGSPYELTHAAVTNAAKALEVDRTKRRWLADYEDEIKEAGGDGEEAYRHYCAGRVDELAARLESEVVEELGEDDEEDDEEDDDEEGEEDDEDEEDEEAKVQ